MLVPIVRCSLIGAVLAFAGLVVPAEANSFTSISGELTIRPLNSHRNSSITADSCSSTEAVAAYEVRNGPGGLLYTDCDRTPFGEDDGPDFYNFVDTSGPERCVGRMKSYWGTAVNTPDMVMEWTIDGAHRGYRCSTIGNTYSVGFRLY